MDFGRQLIWVPRLFARSLQVHAQVSGNGHNGFDGLKGPGCQHMINDLATHDAYFVLKESDTKSTKSKTIGKICTLSSPSKYLIEGCRSLFFRRLFPLRFCRIIHYVFSLAFLVRHNRRPPVFLSARRAVKPRAYTPLQSSSPARIQCQLRVE